MTIEEAIWKKMESKVDAMITRRILAFHDALVERGQIKPATRIAPPQSGGMEVASDIASHCTEDRAA
jgi:hypothetical protein